MGQSGASAYRASRAAAAFSLAAGDLAQFWRTLKESLFDPYRPERHYMRGPGPKWRQKHARVDLQPSNRENLKVVRALERRRVADPTATQGAEDTVRSDFQLPEVPGRSIRGLRVGATVAGIMFRREARPHLFEPRCGRRNLIAATMRAAR
jgi:hypothetical protein